MSVLDPQLLRILSSQHGVISRRQAVEAGVAPRRVDHLVATGALERLAPQVYGAPGHRDAWRRRLWVGLLHAGPGAVVSHEAAGRLHGFREVPAGMVTLTVPRRRHSSGAVGRWHRSDDLTPDDVVQVNGVPVTTPVRTVVDLAAVLHVATLRQMVEQRVVGRVLTLAQLGTSLGSRRASGRRGVRRLAAVLDELGGAVPIARSELERLADEVVRRANLPTPQHEFPLPGPGPSSGFVDRCWPEALLILEIDGRAWHARSAQLRRDADRMLQAQVAGYETSRILWEHCRHDPSGTAATLRAIHQRRVEQLSAR